MTAQLVIAPKRSMDGSAEERGATVEPQIADACLPLSNRAAAVTVTDGADVIQVAVCHSQFVDSTTSRRASGHGFFVGQNTLW